MNQPEPEPGYRPADMMIPNEVVEYIGTELPHPERSKPRQKELNLTFTHTHAFLIGHIGMFTGMRGIGCWASMGLLAEKLHVTERRVRQLLADCIELGFVIDVGDRPVKFGPATIVRRVLKTAWSRVGNPPPARKSISDPGNLFPTPPEIDFRLLEDKDKEIPQTLAVPLRGTREAVCDLENSDNAEQSSANALQPSVNGATPRDNGSKSVGSGISPTTPSKGNLAPKAQRYEQLNSRNKPGAMPPVSHASVSLDKPKDNAGGFGSSDSMNTLPPTDLVSPLPTPSRELRATQKLHDAVVRRYSHAPKYRSSAWIKEFQSLWKELTDPPKKRWPRMGAVLDWYCEHIGENQYLPDVRSAKSFREKFGKLEAAMQKAQEANSPEEIEEPHPETQYILEEVEGLYWPKGSAQQLPAAIDRSAKNMSRFYSVLKAVDPEDLSPDAKFLRERILAEMHGVDFDLPNWFRTVQKKASWDDWTGNLKNEIWRADHPNFFKQADAWIREWTSQSIKPKHWEEIQTAAKRVS